LGTQALGHQRHDRDHPAGREVGVFDRLTWTGEDVPTRKADQLQPGLERSELLLRESCQEVVLFARTVGHVLSRAKHTCRMADYLQTGARARPNMGPEHASALLGG